MYRKSGCIVKKHRFYAEKLNFTSKTRFSIGENSNMYRKYQVVSLKRTGFIRKD